MIWRSPGWTDQAMKNLGGEPSHPKDWWREFFQPITAEIMFVPKIGQTEREVAQVLRQTRAKTPLDVLDLACGTGRHAMVFAARGFTVTGLDYSHAYLREARKTARKIRASVRFVHGDMRQLRPHFAANSFGMVVSLFNSFGYFDHRRDDFQTLKAINRVLKPGGWLVVNTLNEAGVARRLKKPISSGREPLSQVIMVDAAQYDRAARRTTCRWTIVDARRPKAAIFRKSFTQNVYSHAEMKNLLRAAGFSIEKTWGVLSGGPFDARKSWHQTIAARKPE
jgi:ubiquinone/menaquinone biosynthesis C-methylase UbiE